MPLPAPPPPPQPEAPEGLAPTLGHVLAHLPRGRGCDLEGKPWPPSRGPQTSGARTRPDRPAGRSPFLGLQKTYPPQSLQNCSRKPAGPVLRPEEETVKTEDDTWKPAPGGFTRGTEGGRSPQTPDPERCPDGATSRAPGAPTEQCRCISSHGTGCSSDRQATATKQKRRKCSCPLPGAFVSVLNRGPGTPGRRSAVASSPQNPAGLHPLVASSSVAVSPWVLSSHNPSHWMQGPS